MTGKVHGHDPSDSCRSTSFRAFFLNLRILYLGSLEFDLLRLGGCMTESNEEDDETNGRKESVNVS
jgi:hypothetical protein